MADETPVTSRILVPIDGSELSEQALPYAANLGAAHSRLYVLRVAPHAEEIRSAWGGVVATEAEVEQMSDEEAKLDIERALKWLSSSDEVETEIIRGDPADQILQTALRHSVDLIVMASHGRGALGRWTFGSVADRVSRESLIPVMIICPAAGVVASPEIKRLVVPFDGSELSKRAIPVATEIARQLAIPIHMVRVISPATALYPTIALSAPLSDDSYQTILNMEKQSAEEELGANAMALLDAGIAATFQLLVGPTVEGIELVLQPGDVVIITSHGRGGIRRWLLGSVAERLIRDGKAPVILVPSAERQTVAERMSNAVPAMAVAPA